MSLSPGLHGFGVSRQHGGARLEEAAHLFAGLLAEQLGKTASLRIADDYPNLLDAVLTGETDVAWMPPLPLARAVQSGAILACLTQRRGQLTYRSALLVRTAAKVENILHLRDARAAWTNPSSAGGYLIPRASLAEHGLSPARLVSEVFFGSTAAACDAVITDQADLATCYVSHAAATDALVAERELAHTLGPRANSQLRVLAITGAIPPDGIVLASQLPATERAQLRTALLELYRAPGGPEALSGLMHAERLASPTYDAMRLLTRLCVQALPGDGTSPG